MADVDITISGPLFDGRAARELADYCDQAREDIAEFGEEYLLTLTGEFFKNPTPYYETRVTTERASADVSRVHDQGVVYGPWLEGVGSRNFPVTRFKGYGHWRKTKDVLALRGLDIAEHILQRYLPRVR